MIDIENVRRLNNYDTDSLIPVLELNEDRLYAWLVLAPPSMVRDDSMGEIVPFSQRRL